MSVQFDYKNQAWVENGVYVRCGHPELMECGCFGRIHAGEAVNHQQDSDCDVDVYGECVLCGVLHGDPCAFCGGKGFHQYECVAISPSLTVQTPHCCHKGIGAPDGVCACCEAENRLLVDAVYGEDDCDEPDVDDTVHACPNCERSQGFSGLCSACLIEMRESPEDSFWDKVFGANGTMVVGGRRALTVDGAITLSTKLPTEYGMVSPALTDLCRRKIESGNQIKTRLFNCHAEVQAIIAQANEALPAGHRFEVR